MPVVGKDDKFPLYCLKFVCVCVKIKTSHSMNENDVAWCEE